VASSCGIFAVPRQGGAPRRLEPETHLDVSIAADRDQVCYVKRGDEPRRKRGQQRVAAARKFLVDQALPVGSGGPPYVLRDAELGQGDGLVNTRSPMQPG